MDGKFNLSNAIGGVSFSMSFKYSVRIKETNLDLFGHVYNATYLTLFEEARWGMMVERGYPVEKVIREQKGPIILTPMNIGCEFWGRLQFSCPSVQMVSSPSFSSFIILNGLFKFKKILVCSNEHRISSESKRASSQKWRAFEFFLQLLSG